MSLRSCHIFCCSCIVRLCRMSADNVSGTHTTSTRYGASSDAAPAQRLLVLAWEHAEELFGQRVATDWHNAWQHGSGPVGVAGAPGMSGGSMFGVYKQKARWVCRNSLTHRVQVFKSCACNKADTACMLLELSRCCHLVPCVVFERNWHTATSAIHHGIVHHVEARFVWCTSVQVLYNVVGAYVCVCLMPCRSELVITVAPIAVRAAFSNIHTWTVLKSDLQLAGEVCPSSQLASAGHGLCQSHCGRRIPGAVAVVLPLLG